MKVTVIISTFNAPEWLEKVIVGYSCQTYKDFSIVIADDGSGPETKEVIERLTAETGLDIQHLWHPHEGYRRQTILNRAIVESKGDYLILTDGDCIPRKDFVATHAALAEKGRFLSGGYCKLSMKVSQAISKEDILDQSCFKISWLKSQDSLGTSQARKLGASSFTGMFLDWITTAKASFNNCNSSAWKEDLLAVNGYDERMKYGGADREIGERLTNNGIRGKQIRHRAIVVHLDHARVYKTKESISRNRLIRKETRTRSIKRTPFGIRQLQS